MIGCANMGFWIADMLEPPGTAPWSAKHHRALVRALVTCCICSVLGLMLWSMRGDRRATGPVRYAVDVEEIDTDIPGVPQRLVITATDEESGYRATLADDPSMWYGRAALTQDGSRLVFVAARINSRRETTEPGLYVAEVTPDRLGRPYRAGPAVRTVAFSEIPIYGILPSWMDDGSRVVYCAPVLERERLVQHVFLADLRTRKVLDLTPRFPLGAANPSFSEESGRITFTGRSIDDGKKRWDVYTILPDGTGLRRLTHPGNTDVPLNVCPRWTKDGQAVLFTDKAALYRISADGSGRPQPAR